MSYDNRVWSLGFLNSQQMFSVSGALVGVWPSLSRPYWGMSLKDSQDLWLAIFDLLDNPRSVSAGQDDGGKIRHIFLKEYGTFSRESGGVEFSSFSGTKITFYQSRGNFSVQVNFGRRSVTAASLLLAKLGELAQEISVPDNLELLVCDEYGEEDPNYLFGDLRVYKKTYEMLKKNYGEKYLMNVKVVDAI